MKKYIYIISFFLFVNPLTAQNITNIFQSVFPTCEGDNNGEITVETDAVGNTPFDYELSFEFATSPGTFSSPITFTNSANSGGSNATFTISPLSAQNWKVTIVATGSEATLQVQQPGPISPVFVTQTNKDFTILNKYINKSNSHFLNVGMAVETA